MPALESAFNHLEARLQLLVEGSLARLFPTPAWQAELARGLTDALRHDARPMEATGATNAPMLAPDHFVIFLPAHQARLFQENPGLLAALAEHLRQAALEAGFYFSVIPSLRALPAPESDARHIQVVAHFSQEHSGQTEFLSEPLLATPAPTAPAAAFLIVDGARLFPLTEAVTNIGRLPDNHLAIPNGRISRHHAQLRLVRDRYVIFDLGSTGGTFVNGRRITQCTLQQGDIISLAGVPLVFGADSADTAAPTQEIPSARH